MAHYKVGATSEGRRRPARTPASSALAASREGVKWKSIGVFVQTRGRSMSSSPRRFAPSPSCQVHTLSVAIPPSNAIRSNDGYYIVVDAQTMSDFEHPRASKTVNKEAATIGERALTKASPCAFLSSLVCYGLSYKVTFRERIIHRKILLINRKITIRNHSLFLSNLMIFCCIHQ